MILSKLNQFLVVYSSLAVLSVLFMPDTLKFYANLITSSL